MIIDGGLTISSGCVISRLIPFWVDYLVVAGGASGTSSGNGGSPGGGAGGLIYRQTRELEKNTQYVITIGAGGAGGTQVTSNPGTNTTVVGGDMSLTAIYGGGATKNPPYVTNGLPGGSGGGASRDGSVGGAGIQPIQPGESGLYGFGNAGARLGSDTGGGGGGAGAAASGSNGGAGKSYDISGTSQFYAGGGGGNNYSGGVDGTGGSGVGGNAPGGNAVVNTGSGGAGRYGGSAGSSGSGSSGICIFKYLDTYPAATTTGSPTITVAGGFRIYKFTGSGTIIFN